MARERIHDRNVWVVYLAIVLLGVAYGTSIAVLAVHLDAQRISKLAMGGLAAAFAFGIAAFALPAGWCIRRFGARATFAVALAGYAVCVAAFPFVSTLGVLTALRFLDGAFSVNAWVSAETVLLSRSSAHNKGYIMSLYAISLALGYVVGPVLSMVLVPWLGTSASFMAAGLLAALASVVVRLGLDDTRDAESAPAAAAPAAHDTQSPPAADVHAISATAAPAAESSPTSSPPVVLPGSVGWRVKTSCLATFSYGYFQASVVLFLPLFLMQAKGLSEAQTIVVPAFFAAGMLLVSTAAGRLGDRVGHLRVMRGLACLGALMVLGFVWLPAFWMMCVAVFVAGASLASISPVSLALLGAVTRHTELSRANALYNTAYALGMLMGPPASGYLFTHYDGGWMLFHLTALWGLFVAFTVVFRHDDPRWHRAGDPIARPEAAQRLPSP